MITIRAKMPQIDAAGAYRRLIVYQEAGIYEGAEFFARSQSDRMIRGEGPNGPQKALSPAYAAWKVRNGYPKTPLVRDRLLSKEWFVWKRPLEAFVEPPRGRRQIAKHLKRRGFTFGVSQGELEEIRRIKNRHMQLWKLSRSATARIIG